MNNVYLKRYEKNPIMEIKKGFILKKVAVIFVQRIPSGVDPTGEPLDKIVILKEIGKN
ncbi:MAG TPA: hypothetical protein P5150_02970 [Candidatus Ratteibacteria bacterium]|nr:hypothetical protein [bacterium]HRR95680.1 hypothetical protein [Candidatus Ratteibacteria bacterium]